MVALISTILFVTAACGGGQDAAADDRLVAIYSTVIRAAVTQPAGESQPTERAPVFVLGTRAVIPIEIQAGVVDALHDFADIHFIDERSEAIDDADPRKAVHEGGVLVSVSDIPPGPDDVTIEAQRYERADSAVTYAISLHRRGSTWKPVRITTR